ncbi:hypothetical protein VFPBJ_05250 [Purpureocillium lilacinum]|uniref:Uncharacterized protein n=1 Tax=Purpureocillium lilacinum TaxID=33203 RepID=A0A179GP35_PURLI|nr:hypothetical protein VFPBJ_05250 [Purpureocillium lilacinum]
MHMALVFSDNGDGVATLSLVAWRHTCSLTARGHDSPAAADRLCLAGRTQCLDRHRC